MKEFRDLLEKYHAGILTREELAAIQKLLTQNESFRREFLLYSQVEITLANQILFHNELERPIKSGESSGPVSVVPPVLQNESVPVRINRITRLNLGEI